MTPGLCCRVCVAQDSGPRGMLQVVQVMDRLPTAYVTGAPPPVFELGRPPLRLTCPLHPVVVQLFHHQRKGPPTMWSDRYNPFTAVANPRVKEGHASKTYGPKTRTASPYRLSASLTTCRSSDAYLCCLTHAHHQPNTYQTRTPARHLPITCPSPAHHLPITCTSPAHHLPIAHSTECI
jgi:hypothetical protein